MSTTRPATSRLSGHTLPPRGLPRRLALAFLATGLITGRVPARAAEVARLGVVSVMGDVLTVVTHRPETGSRVDQNQHQPVALGEQGFDRFAAQVAVEQARRALPGAEVLALELAPREDIESGTWLQAQHFEPPAAVRARLDAAGLTHLLLLTRHRADAQLRLRRNSVGSGHLEGLGFYVDRALPVRRVDTGELGQGFLAPYAYFQVALIEVASGRVLAAEAITASASASAARGTQGLDPWEALDPAQKVAAIQRLIRGELVRAIPQVTR